MKFRHPFKQDEFIFISFPQKYYKEIIMVENCSKYNWSYKKAVDSIGSIYSSEISGSNSPTNKGLRKIVRHTFKDHNEKLSNREIKTLFSNYNKEKRGKTEYYFRIPYNLAYILLSLKDLLCTNAEFNNFISVNHTSETGEFRLEQIFTPFHYDALNRAILNFDLRNQSGKIKHEWVIDKMRKLKEDIDSLPKF